MRAWPYQRYEPGASGPQDGQQLVPRTSVTVPDSPMRGGGAGRGQVSSPPTWSTFPELCVCIGWTGCGKECGLGRHRDPGQTPAPPLISCVVLRRLLCLSDPVFLAVTSGCVCPVMSLNRLQKGGHMKHFLLWARGSVNVNVLLSTHLWPPREHGSHQPASSAFLPGPA